MSHFRREGPPDITDTYSLLVLNISFRLTVDDLFPLFDKYGEVVDIFIPRDRRTGNSRGFAFVRYQYADEAQEAVDRLDGRMVDGRQMAVQFAKYGPNAEKIQDGRILEPVTKLGSPRGRYRDDYRERDYPRRSWSRSLDGYDPNRYDLDRYRERDRSYSHRCRSRSYSPQSPHHRSSRGRDRYNDEKSASPPRRSRSSRRSISPRLHNPSHSKSHTPDRRGHKGPPASPRHPMSPPLVPLRRLDEVQSDSAPK